jgi:hypothetical protein
MKMGWGKNIWASRPGGRFDLLILIALLIGGAPLVLAATETLPEAAEVTRRLIERSRAVAQADQGTQYTYQKRTLLEHLDAKGHGLKSEEKVYRVKLIGGIPYKRLIKIQGRELSPGELRAEDLKDEKFRDKFVSAERKKSNLQKEGLVTAELLARYQFVVEERVILSNRPTLVLSYRPKEGRPASRTIEDKLLNSMAGRLWVDEQDADTARLQVSLVEPVFLGWFGLLGSLTQCDLSLERQRMPDGVWVNVKQTLLIECRKLIATSRFRTTDESSEFKPVGR